MQIVINVIITIILIIYDGNVAQYGEIIFLHRVWSAVSWIVELRCRSIDLLLLLFFFIALGSKDPEG